MQLFQSVLLNVGVFSGFNLLSQFVALRSLPSNPSLNFCEDRMRWGVKNFAGRTRRGRIVCRGRGGRVWSNSPYVDRIRRLSGECGQVVKVVREPAQSAYLAFSLYGAMGVFTYVLGWQGIDTKLSFMNIDSLNYRVGVGVGVVERSVGNTFLLGQLPIGTRVFNVEMYPGSGGLFTRSAGALSRVLQKITVKGNQIFVAIRLASGVVRYVHGKCAVTVGQASNARSKKISLKKAGKRRYLGFRPKVRGVAMNPVDHPHGGGEGKTSGGRISVTPWGRLTKGKKTLSKSYRRRVVLRLNRIQSGRLI